MHLYSLDIRYNFQKGAFPLSANGNSRHVKRLREREYEQVYCTPTNLRKLWIFRCNFPASHFHMHEINFMPI